MRRLVWRRSDYGSHTAGNLVAALGQYRIWQDRGDHFRVVHRRLSTSGEYHAIGTVDSLDHAKALAQVYADAQTNTDALVSDCPACGCVTRIPLLNGAFCCDACSAPLIREVRVATKDEIPEAA